MAGFFAHFGPAQPHRLSGAAERFRFADEHEEAVAGDGFSFVWSGLNDPDLFGPAYDAATGVRVVTAGRVSWDEPEWTRAEALVQYEGGLSCRLLLDAYLSGGVSAVERHNGPAMLVVWDPRSREVHLLTDHFGYHPVFLYRPDDPRRAVIATHADVLADDPDVTTTEDRVTMAEFLRFWRATPPHTYYREIKYAGPATRWTWNLDSGTVASAAYWQPHQEEPFPDIHAASEELAASLTHAVRIRTLPRLSPSVVYASGGMDSRAVLFASADPGGMSGLNLYEVPNAEADVTRRLCEAAGVRYEGFRRDDDYYPRWLAENARLSGAMWSAEDGHFLGTAARVRELGARTVLSGCTADRVFKASPMETRYKRLFGRNLPLKELRPERVEAFLPNHPHPAPPALKDAIEQRFAAWFAGTPTHFREDRDWLAVEDRRVRPNAYASSVSGPMMYRILPYDTFLADRALADCYSRIKAAWKVDARVWGLAVARLSGVHRDIEVAHHNWHLDDSVATRLAVFARGWMARRLRPPAPVQADGPATEGSWPMLNWYAEHSPTLRALWESADAEDRALLTAVWGTDPWARSLEEWADQPNAFFRLQTLLAYRRSRRADASP